MVAELVELVVVVGKCWFQVTSAASDLLEVKLHQSDRSWSQQLSSVLVCVCRGVHRSGPGSG